MTTLSDLDRSLLAFESQWWQRPGAKEQAIRDQLGITPTRYLQLLNRLIDLPAAVAYDPVVVNRLRGSGSAGRRSAHGRGLRSSTTAKSQACLPREYPGAGVGPQPGPGCSR